ncbi:MAG: MFS transporter [Candidatus Lokiarchaeota archaeon]|nr:MFS transporter [Candidatus Lokiarchaeota archaeon]
MTELANKKTFKNYIFLYSGQLFSLLGSSITQFVIIWWITIETGSIIILSIASFVYILPMTLSMPIAGVIVDRYNRKKIIVIVDSLQAFTTLFIILLFNLEITEPFVIIILNGLLGLFQGFHMPTVSAIVPTMVPKDKLSRINGLSFLFSGFIHTIGPIIAATLLTFLPIKSILWIDPITFIIALIPLILIKIPIVRSGEETQIKKSSFITEIKEGFQTLKLIPVISMMLLVSMFINFLLRPFQTLMPYFIYFINSGSPSDLALISAFISGGMLMGAIITSIKKEWKHKIFIFFSGEAALFLPTVVFIFLPKGSFLLMGIVGAVYGMIMPILNTIYLTLIQTKVPADKMGRISSIDWTVSLAISPFGVLFAGFIAEFVGVSNLILYCAIAGVIVTMIIWRFTSVRYNHHQEKDEVEILK